MKKRTYELGNNRVLKVSKNCQEIIFTDKSTGKYCCFSQSRWATFMLIIDEIEMTLQKVLAGQKDIRYRYHLGAAWHVSVTSGFKCIDFRRFFLPLEQTDIKPTRTGLALRISEWQTLRSVITKLHVDQSEIANCVPCFLSADHTTAEGIRCCSECTPFGHQSVNDVEDAHALSTSTSTATTSSSAAEATTH